MSALTSLTSATSLKNSWNSLPASAKELVRVLGREAREDLNRRHREAAREHLLDFTTYTFPQYKPDPAHRLIASKLDEVVAGKCKRLMIFAPPQSGKTELVSVRLPAYWLGRRPNDPVIMCTYGASLAHNKSRQSRAVVESDEYAELFPKIGTDPSSRAVDHWELAHPNRGGLLATGVGGPVTGHGGMCFPAGTMITTSEGQVDIAELYRRRSWPAILTYNEKAGMLEWGRIVGTHSQVDRDYQYRRCLVESVTGYYTEQHNRNKNKLYQQFYVESSRSSLQYYQRTYSDAG